MKETYALVVSPHPDDAEIGAAGTIADWTRRGKRVAYCITTNGDKGTDDRSLSSQQVAAMREHEQRAAAEAVGVSEVTFLGYPDQSLEDTPELRRQLVRLIRRYRPCIVLTVDPYKKYIIHRDHRSTGQAVLDAVFPYARDYLAYPDLIAEGLEPHKVREVLLWNTDDVNFKIDISATIEDKIAALACHESQLAGLGISDVSERVRTYCRRLAEGEDFEFAEAFHRVEYAYGYGR